MRSNNHPAKSKRLVLPQNQTTREPLPTGQFADVLRNLSKLEERDAVLVALFSFTGMRRGEVLGLQWKHIDLDAKLIHVNQNATFKGNQPVIGTPKSEKGTRVLPITNELLPYLHPSLNDSFVIGGGEKPITESCYDRTMERIGKTINLHNATAHVFRHTFMTLLGGTSTDVKTLQSIGGHGDIRTTMNRYVHTRPEGILSAGEAYSKMTQDIIGQTCNVACDTPSK